VIEENELTAPTIDNLSIAETDRVDEEQLYADVRQMVLAARERAALYVNQELTLLYWNVGRRIQHDILGFERAPYGKQIVENLSTKLIAEFGKGYGRANLFSMMDVAKTYPNEQIIQTLSGQLTWSHLLELLRIDDPRAREFYGELTRLHHWGVRALRERIQSRLYERTLLSRKPDDLIAQELTLLREEDKLTVDMVLRDPYLLSGLGLGDTYSERELEDAIIREMEAFLLEIGDGFAFIARQKRFPSPASGGKVRELDLLFYHRKLKRLVAIELKVGSFEPEHKGQMEYYLNWLSQNEREEGEEPPIGIILCSEAHPDDVSLMGLESGDIRVARYITETLPPSVLEKKLREIVARQKEFQARKEQQKEKS
jgi:predicted nuclease of restriction endonuclease-like (RecB) superfamily